MHCARCAYQIDLFVKQADIVAGRKIILVGQEQCTPKLNVLRSACEKVSFILRKTLI